jgi:hypothetical protein
MRTKLTKAEMIQLVEKIQRDDIRNPEEQDAWLDLLDDSLPVPSGYFCSLIFWSQNYGLGNDPSAEAIVEKALEYRPILL